MKEVCRRRCGNRRRLAVEVSRTAPSDQSESRSTPFGPSHGAPTNQRRVSGEVIPPMNCACPDGVRLYSLSTRDDLDTHALAELDTFSEMKCGSLSDFECSARNVRSTRSARKGPALWTESCYQIHFLIQSVDQLRVKRVPVKGEPCEPQFTRDQNCTVKKPLRRESQCISRRLEVCG
jgi:hypothetical protein